MARPQCPGNKVLRAQAHDSRMTDSTHSTCRHLRTEQRPFIARLGRSYALRCTPGRTLPAKKRGAANTVERIKLAARRVPSRQPGHLQTRVVDHRGPKPDWRPAGPRGSKIKTVLTLRACGGWGSPQPFMLHSREAMRMPLGHLGHPHSHITPIPSRIKPTDMVSLRMASVVANRG